MDFPLLFARCMLLKSRVPVAAMAALLHFGLKNLGPGRLSESPTGFPNLQQSSAVQRMAKLLTKEMPSGRQLKGPVGSFSKRQTAATSFLHLILGWAAKGSTGIHVVTELDAV